MDLLPFPPKLRFVLLPTSVTYCIKTHRCIISTMGIVPTVTPYIYPFKNETIYSSNDNVKFNLEPLLNLLLTFLKRVKHC